MAVAMVTCERSAITCISIRCEPIFSHRKRRSRNLRGAVILSICEAPENVRPGCGWIGCWANWEYRRMMRRGGGDLPRRWKSGEARISQPRGRRSGAGGGKKVSVPTIVEFSIDAVLALAYFRRHGAKTQSPVPRRALPPHEPGRSTGTHFQRR